VLNVAQTFQSGCSADCSRPGSKFQGELMFVASAEWILRNSRSGKYALQVARPTGALRHSARSVDQEERGFRRPRTVVSFASVPSREIGADRC